MKMVQRLIFSLIAATTVQTTCAMQPSQQLDITAQELAIFCSKNIAPEYRDACITKVNAITNQQQLVIVRNDILHAHLKTILHNPVSTKNERKIETILFIAIANKDLCTVQCIAANLEAILFSDLIHHRCKTITMISNPEITYEHYTPYQLAEEEAPAIAKFFDKYFPPAK